MIESIRRFYYRYLEYKHKTYLRRLVRNGLRLGENVTIMDGCFLDPTHCFLVSIGANTVLAPCVRLIAHDASMKQTVGRTKIGRIVVGKNCFLGDSTIILPGITVGDNTVIGAGSVVTHDIPANSIVAGNPCRVLGKRDDATAKHKKQIRLHKTPFAEKDQGKLTDNEKEQLLDFLHSGPGYIR